MKKSTWKHAPGNKYFNLRKIPPFVSEGLQKPDYMKYEKNTIIKLTHLSPNKYLKECAKARGKTGALYREHLMINKNTVKEYAKSMLQKSKFPVPYIDYRTGDQEGRHRAAAVQWLIDNKQIKSTQIPVIILTNSNHSTQEQKTYMIKKYSMWFGEE